MRSLAQSICLALGVCALCPGCDVFVQCDPETGDGCTTSIDKTCTPHFRQGCSSSNALSWYDSCNNIESLISTCPQGCVNNQCVGGACTEAWSCSSWSTCGCDSKQYRTCTDSNSCGTTSSKPLESQACSICGNGSCDCGETSASCPVDCYTCLDDEHEDNDQMGSAADMMIGTMGNLKICKEDADYYKYNVPSGYMLVVDIYFTNSNGNLDMELYSGSGTLLAYSYSSSADSEHVEAAGNGSNLFVKVYGVGQVSNNYYMQIQLVAICVESWTCDSWSTCPCGGGTHYRTCWDANSCGTTVNKPAESESCQSCGDGTCDPGCGETLESCGKDCDTFYEPNYVQADAITVAADGTAISPLFLYYGDNDWYKVYVPGWKHLTAQIDFVHSGSGDLDMYLYDAASNVLGSSTTTTNQEKIEKDGAGAYYYLNVYGYQNTCYNSYSMTLNLTCLPDALDANDTKETAQPVTAGTYDNLTACPLNEDWYKITYPAGGSMSVQINFTHADGDLNMYLYDGGGVLLQSSATGNDLEFVLHNGALGGDFYAKVVGYNSYDQNIYQMVVNIAP